jgi:hypothetical protein
MAGLLQERAMDRKAHVYKGSPPNHCCCDQALRVLPGGEWAVFFMTGGVHEPERENYIALCRSADEGRTWSAPETVLRRDDRACTLSEVIVHGGEVRIFMQTHRGRFDDWRVFTLVSRDGGRTWDEPAPFAPMPRRAFLRNLYVATWGEWYLPFQHYDTMPDPASSPREDGSFERAFNKLCRTPHNPHYVVLAVMSR